MTYSSSGIGQTWYNMKLLSDEDTELIWQQLYTACQSSNLSELPTIQKEFLGYIKGPNQERYVIGFLQPGGNANYTLFVNSNGLAEGFILNNSNRGTISSDDEIVIENSLSGNTGIQSYSLDIPDSVINGTILPPILPDVIITSNITSNIITETSNSNIEEIIPTLDELSNGPVYSDTVDVAVDDQMSAYAQKVAAELAAAELAASLAASSNAPVGSAGSLLSGLQSNVQKGLKAIIDNNPNLGELPIYSIITLKTLYPSATEITSSQLPYISTTLGSNGSNIMTTLSNLVSSYNSGFSISDADKLVLQTANTTASYGKMTLNYIFNITPVTNVNLTDLAGVITANSNISMLSLNNLVDINDQLTYPGIITLADYDKIKKILTDTNAANALINAKIAAGGNAPSAAEITSASANALVNTTNTLSNLNNVLQMQKQITLTNLANISNILSNRPTVYKTVSNTLVGTNGLYAPGIITSANSQQLYSAVTDSNNPNTFTKIQNILSNNINNITISKKDIFNINLFLSLNSNNQLYQQGTIGILSGFL